MRSFSGDSLEKLIYFRREIDRIFREVLDPHQSDTLLEEGYVQIPLDIFETEEEIIIEAEIPGVEREKIELSVLKDILVIEGVKPKTIAPEEPTYCCLERTFGRFRRIVEIPGTGDTRNIKGEFDKGVLRVRLPKIHERRGHRRKVQID